MRKRWLKFAAVPISLALVAASCSTEDDGDDADSGSSTPAGTEAPGDTATDDTATDSSEPATEGTEPLPSTPGAGSAGSVTVFGVEDSENEAGAMQDALTEFGDGQRDRHHLRRSPRLRAADQRAGARRQPARHRRLPAARQARPVRQGRRPAAAPRRRRSASVQENWADSYLAFSNVDGTQYGVPFKSDLKSLVWYVPSVWKEKGYEVPKTLTEFKTLMDKMIANGDTPLCVGIESGAGHRLAVHRLGRGAGPARAGHRLLQPVGRPRGPVRRPAGRSTRSTRSPVPTACGRRRAPCTPPAVRSPPRRSVTTAEPLVQGKCMMHRQANFFSAFFPEGTQFGDGDGQVSTFYFPSDEGHPVLVGGISAGAFRDAPEVWKVMEYLGSAEFANARQAAQSERVGGGTLRLPHRQHERRHDASGHRSSRASSSTLQTAEPGGVRRLRPDAGRGRLRHVLDGGHVVRQRRRGRQDGDREHPGVVAELIG